FALLIVAGVSYWNKPSSVSQNGLLLTPAAYAKELVKKSAETLAGSNAVPLPTAVTCTIEGVPKGASGTTEIKDGKCVIQWVKPDDNGMVRDEKGNIIFTTTPEGELVPAPRPIPSLEQRLEQPRPIPDLEQRGGYPNALFNDMTKARNTAYFYIVIKPTSLTNEQIAILRDFGVRMLQLPSQDEITMLKNIGVGISDEKSVYAALIEEDQVEKIKKLDFVVSVTLPQVMEMNGIDLNDAGLSDELSYTVTKDSFKSFLEEAKKADDLAYLGDKILSVGKRVRVLRFTDEKGSTVILGIDENNYPVVRLAYSAGGGVMFGSGAINGQTPSLFNPEETVNFWTENLEQPTDFKAIQK
ncbi:hypothetical protein KJ636_03855, partial [Patescibacteria group bacterium]|nr:hypothetical protein [Patescibacteria group bacterium]